jgi:hypothetical protein
LEWLLLPDLLVVLEAAVESPVPDEADPLSVFVLEVYSQISWIVPTSLMTALSELTYEDENGPIVGCFVHASAMPSFIFAI